MRQPRKYFKHNQAILRQQPMNYLNLFDNFVGLALKGLSLHQANVTFLYSLKAWDIGLKQYIGVKQDIHAFIDNKIVILF